MLEVASEVATRSWHSGEANRREGHMVTDTSKAGALADKGNQAGKAPADMRMVEQVKVVNGYLVMCVKLDTKGRPSSTGKSTVHASTGGFTAIDGSAFRVNLTVIKKA